MIVDLKWAFRKDTHNLSNPKDDGLKTQGNTVNRVIDYIRSEKSELVLHNMMQYGPH